MKRREFMTLLGSAAAWPVLVRAQQSMAVVGLLAPTTADAPSGPFDAVHLALRQAGLEVDRAVRMEYRYANNDLNRLSALAAELVAIPATVIISTGGLRPRVRLESCNDRDSDRVFAGG